jgi:hypothetical protein
MSDELAHRVTVQVVLQNICRGADQDGLVVVTKLDGAGVPLVGRSEMDFGPGRPAFGDHDVVWHGSAARAGLESGRQRPVGRAAEAHDLAAICCFDHAERLAVERQTQASRQRRTRQANSVAPHDRAAVVGKGNRVYRCS